MLSHIKKCLNFELLPLRIAPMTQLLILINVVVFVLQILFNAVTENGVYRSDVWYSYATSIFLHGGLRHILMNMMFLSFLAPIVEFKYGSFNLFVIYMITGIFGNMTQAFFEPLSTGLGASGSIMGIMMFWILINILAKRLFVIIPAILYLIMEGVFGGLTLIYPDGIGHIVHFGSAMGALILFSVLSPRRK
jgi:rhomboid protease GluP